VGTGGLSTVSKVGWVGKLGKGVFIWDTGGNLFAVSKGGIGIAQNGLNLQNGVQVFGGLFGLGGNVAGRYGRNLPLGRSTDDAAEALPSKSFSPNSVGAAGRNLRVLQTGKNKITPATARGLNQFTGMNLHRREWGRALEKLKKAEGLPNNHHGRILENGDYVDDDANLIGNLIDYLS